MDFFTASGVSKQFGNVRALDRVTIQVPRQNIFGLLGPNGAGKTTLIRIINQITMPDEGEILLDGRKLAQEDVQHIGYLPEERGLYKKMKVGEQALYLARLKGLSKQEALRRLREWFTRFGIQSWWNKKLEDLSKGMQQKVQFITTVIHEPRLLIFDEPFSGFDPINVDLLKKEILALRDKGATVIFSTHNMASVEELCDNIALIDKSRKILDGRVNDIKREYRSNSFEVTFSGFTGSLRALLPGDFSLLSEAPDGDLIKAQIRLPSSLRSNDLLGALLPHLTIRSFVEIMPSMHDIFVSRVMENKENLSRENDRHE
jgi:ABC-2 type transport system ATP-binding protein